MPVRPFLTGQAFDPDTVEAMSAAFTDVRATLGHAGRDDAMTQMVARHIIKLAQSGVRTKDALSDSRAI
jgi:hypothetical protein